MYWKPEAYTNLKYKNKQISIIVFLFRAKLNGQRNTTLFIIIKSGQFY